VYLSIPALPLTPGRYRLGFWIGQGSRAIDSLRDCMTIEVAPGRLGDGDYVGSRTYPLVVPTEWHASPVPK
jgi:hypothetical protein